ncbi:putative peptidase family M28 [Naviculisporaceae sp. PSN 640]
MRFSTLCTVLASTASFAAAAPAVDGKVTTGLRLIKTSPEDPGKWVTDAEKMTMSVKGQHFIDITDITDPEVLAILSTPDDVEAEKVAVRAITYPSSPSKQSTANPLISQVSTTNPQSWLQTLTSYNNRHYKSTTGTQSATWLFNTVKSVAAANSAITVRQFTHSAFNQPSIIATIPGTSSNLVIVGAHFDSTAGSTSARAPGADDNGSGTVTILEALRVLANAKYAPKNTLEFHFYAGEEGGLLGSAAIFSNYKSARKNVLAFLNQDMTGYSPNGKIAIYTDYVDSALTTYVTSIAQSYIGATLSDRCGYGCSDHASARSNGFPAAYACEDKMSTSSPYIHTSNDAYSTVQWPAVLRHSKFTVAFLVEASFL